MLISAFTFISVCTTTKESQFSSTLNHHSLAQRYMSGMHTWWLAVAAALCPASGGAQCKRSIGRGGPFQGCPSAHVLRRVALSWGRLRESTHTFQLDEKEGRNAGKRETVLPCFLCFLRNHRNLLGKSHKASKVLDNLTLL